MQQSRGVYAVAVVAALALVAGALWPSSQPSFAVGSGTWTQYAHDAQRTGKDPAEQTPFSSATLDWDHGVVGNVYAQPLVYNGRVYVATEENFVYALDATTGAEVWHEQVGAPAPASVVPNGCSNSNPNIGITSTPAIDPVRNRIYVVAQHNTPLRYDFMALNLTDGSVISSLTRTLDPWPGATQADKAAQDALQIQRSALLLMNDYVYVAWGGRAECGVPNNPNYQGWLVAVPLANQPGGVRVFHEPQNASGVNGGGIWAPAGPSADTAGNIYVPTANSFEPASTTTAPANLSMSVVKLAPDLTLVDHFTQSNWLDETKVDLGVGSHTPSFLGNSLIFQSGKDGRAFLLNDGNLGGGTTITRTGGEVFTSSAVLCTDPSNSNPPIPPRSYGVATSLLPMVFMPCMAGIKGLRVQTTPPVSFQKVWDGPVTHYPSSPMIAGSALWYIDQPSRTLQALNPADGKPRITPITLPGNPVAHFSTPSSGNGRIYAASNAHITAYRLTPASSPPPSNPTPTPTATPKSTPVPGGTGGTGTTLTPVADTYTSRTAPTSTAGGSSTFLRADLARTDTAFLRFDLSSVAGKTIKTAQLRIHTTTLGWAGSAVTFNIRFVSDNGWKEPFMSFNNTVSPLSIAAVPMGTLKGPAPNTFYTSSPLDLKTVQAHVGGLLSIAMDAPQADVLIFDSRESGTATAPQLLLTL